MLSLLFLAFVLMGSYYVWTGPEATPMGERAVLELAPAGGTAEGPSPPIEAEPPIPLAVLREREAPIEHPAASAEESVVADFGVVEVLPRLHSESIGKADEDLGEDDPSEPVALRHVVVETGDTLTSLARRHLGDGTRWREIFLANREAIGDDPHALRVGQVLRLPADPPR